MIYRRAQVTVICFGIMGLPFAAAADTTDSAQLDIQKKQLDIASANLKLQTDSLTAMKSGYTGAATVDSSAGAAEALVLQDFALQQAMQVVAAKIQPFYPEKPFYIVMGSDHLDTSHWLAFSGATSLLSDNFKQAIEAWEIAMKPLPPINATPPSPNAHNGNKGYKPTYYSYNEGYSSVALPIAAIETVAGLFKSDWGLSGSTATPDTNKVTTILYQALGRQKAHLVTPQLRRRSAADVSPNVLVPDLITDRRKAYGYYVEYLKQLQKVDGKTDKLPSDIADAGKGLQTALSDYQAMIKSLYTPTDKGVLPAEVIAYEKELSEGDTFKARVLYIKSAKVATSVYTKKNLFSGFTKAPVYISATADIDFDIVSDDRQSCSGTVSYSTEFVHVIDARRYSYTGSTKPTSASATTPESIHYQALPPAVTSNAGSLVAKDVCPTLPPSQDSQTPG